MQLSKGIPARACTDHELAYSYVEELPIRLAHRVKDLDELPLGLHDMPSIRKVKNWYAQSFEVSCCLNRVATVTNVQ